jgi:hypothetical protein
LVSLFLPSRSSELLTKIEVWLDDEGIPFDRIPDINSKFHVKAQMKNLIVHLRESNVRVGCIVVEGIMALEEDQVELMKKIKDEDQHSLFVKFFRELDRSEYLFQLSKDFSDPIWLKIQRILYSEDLNRTDLLNQMKELNTKFVNINYEINEALDNMAEPPQSEDSSRLYS